MRILFDQGVPRGVTASLRDHEVIEARKLAWERISNGELLKLAEEAGFDLLVTTDKNVRYQQNLAERKISIVVLGNSPWWLVRQHLNRIASAVNEATPGSYDEAQPASVAGVEGETRKPNCIATFMFIHARCAGGGSMLLTSYTP
jgi:hypothetical protein